MTLDLGSMMNKVLIGWGVDPKIAETFDEAIVAILMVILAVGIDYLFRAIFVGGSPPVEHPYSESKAYSSPHTYHSRSFGLSAASHCVCAW